MEPKQGWARRRQVSPAGQSWGSDHIAQGESFVTSCVRLADTEPQQGRLGSKYVHASALISGGWCPRAHLLAATMGVMNSVAQSQQRIVWILGRAAETHVRNQFIKIHGRHRVVGNWECRCGHSTLAGHGSLTSLCQKCGTPLDVYNELVLLDTEHGITGSVDLIFENREGGYEVLENKSIKKESFEKLTSALPDHVLQSKLYVKMLSELFPEKKVGGRVFYVAKDYVAPKMSPYKEFIVTPEFPAILTELRKSVKSMRVHEKAGTLPPRLPACGSPNTTCARNCVACGLCFSYP